MTASDYVGTTKNKNGPSDHHGKKNPNPDEVLHPPRNVKVTFDSSSPRLPMKSAVEIWREVVSPVRFSSCPESLPENLTKYWTISLIAGHRKKMPCALCPSNSVMRPQPQAVPRVNEVRSLSSRVTPAVILAA